MVEDIKRAIDNNDINKLYACGFFVNSTIKEYILLNKKRIINDILNLKLWLDDEVIVTYFDDNDFVKASIMASNVDVARLFNNEEINNFLINNMNHIVKFMNEKLYTLSNKTPKSLLNNLNFIKLCLDNGFINILDFVPDNDYYLKNKERIDKVCYDKIILGIIKIDEFSSKRFLTNQNFLIASILGNNYNVLLFSKSPYLDKYIENNYKKLYKKIEGFIRSNDYFLKKEVNIQLPFFLGIIKKQINDEINNKRFDVSLLKMLDNDEFYNFVSYLDDNTKKDFFGKKIYQLYQFYGNTLFRIGYEKINSIGMFSITLFERFVKIFCFDDNIKMENVRSLYFNILYEEFDRKSKFKNNSAIIFENSIDTNGIINDKLNEKIEELKNILGSSYYDYLVNLINNNYNLDVNKPFNEIVNDVFDAYRRASISLDDNKKNRLNIIIDGLCKAAYKREFDLFASSKMDFSDGYPFLVEPSDIYVKRFYKEKKLEIIKDSFLNDENKFNELCSNIYDESIPYDNYVEEVRKYLKTGRYAIYDINKNVDNYLSKFVDDLNVDGICVEYFNLPLTDEYLKAYFNKNTILNILKDININKLLIMLNDDNYDSFKDVFYDKQILYMLDVFSTIHSFYNISNIVSLIDNFCLVDKENIYEMFKCSNSYVRVPSIFRTIFDNSCDYIKNDSKVIKELLKRGYKTLLKRSLPIPNISKKYVVNNHEISVMIGGYDFKDVYLPIMVNSSVFVNSKYDDLHKYIFSNENGFIIKFYDNKIIGIVFGIRYGNTLFLSNLASVVHMSYIMEPLKKFVLSIIDECKKNNDNLGHIYLANMGSDDKTYTLINGLVSVQTDYNKNGLALYDNMSKINAKALMKYPITTYLLECEQAKIRGNQIKILDLFGNDEEGLINDFEYENIKYAGRSWYKNEDAFVVGKIDDSILKELSIIKERNIN